MDVTDDTGISDIVMDHNDHNIMYASTYQRRRHFGILVAGGPEGGIFKSVDRGKNWKKLNRLVYIISVFGVLHFIWLSK